MSSTVSVIINGEKQNVNLSIGLNGVRVREALKRDSSLKELLPGGVNLSDCPLDRLGNYNHEGRGLDEDALVLVLPGWEADNGDAKVYYALAETDYDAALAYVEDGGWDEITSTVWIRVWVYLVGLTQDRDGNWTKVRLNSTRHTIEKDPPPPDCTEDQGYHEWESPHEVVGGVKENPGVWGHGAGVIIREVCPHCGHYRITDTYAQDPETGEQGLTSVRYEAPDEKSLEWVYSRA